MKSAPAPAPPPASLAALSPSQNGSSIPTAPSVETITKLAKSKEKSRKTRSNNEWFMYHKQNMNVLCIGFIRQRLTDINASDTYLNDIGNIIINYYQWFQIEKMAIYDKLECTIKYGNINTNDHKNTTNKG